MVSILRAVYSGETDERKDRVLQILRLWATKGLYEVHTINSFESQMKSDAPIEAVQKEEEELPPWLMDQGPPFRQ